MYVCTNTQMCVSIYTGLCFLLGSTRLSAIQAGKVTHLLSCINEVLTVSFGIPWCPSNGRNLERPAEGEDRRGWGICPCLCHHIIQIDVLLLFVNSLDSNNDFNEVPPCWKDRLDGKRESSLLYVQCCCLGVGWPWQAVKPQQQEQSPVSTPMSLLLGQCIVVTQVHKGWSQRQIFSTAPARPVLPSVLLVD